ncbi:response regulator [Paenibacillus phocaensis]|uniref:response regulator n=1 Tax=Paenibacillus phocaensis TaxID=1776378 RepID=UPI000839CC91|nr:response regulator [Paenibacillus phocaensis]
MIKVLIVEDDPMVAEMNKFYLEQIQGFRAEGWAASVEQALVLLNSANYDLLLLDIYMKGSSGLELLTEIRRKAWPTDVVVISAASDKNSIRQALNNGAVDYLIKPFEFNRFRIAMDAYRKRVALFKTADSMVQSELDSLTHVAADEAPSVPLPKGFTRQTLQAVWKAIESFPSEGFTSVDISAATGISRVSAGKYLAELESRGVLEMELIYGTIGRPVQRYKIMPQGKIKITKYL